MSSSAQLLSPEADDPKPLAGKQNEGREARDGAPIDLKVSERPDAALPLPAAKGAEILQDAPLIAPLRAQAVEEELRSAVHEIEEILIKSHQPALTPGIESQIDTLRRLGRELGKQNTTGPPSPAQFPAMVEHEKCEVLRLSMRDWRDKSLDDPPVGDSIIAAYYRNVTESQNPGQTGTDNKRTASGKAEMPQRIVISSSLLIEDLEYVLGDSIPDEEIVLAQPYKLLVTFFPEIEARIVEHEARIARPTVVTVHKQEQTSGPHEVKNTESPQQSSNQHSVVANTDPNRRTLIRRTAHLRLLRDLIKTELSRYLELKDEVASGTLNTISFEDLWYLFRPGDLLFTHANGVETLNKIYTVSGGQQKRTQEPGRYRTPISDSDPGPGSESDAEVFHQARGGKSFWGPLEIRCYGMAFDGSRVGPVSSCKRIWHYSGDCKIDELPMFPLRFHPDQQRIMSRLEQRGRQYITSAGHKSYRGLTIEWKSTSENSRFPSDTKVNEEQELDGDIYVDFKEFYRGFPRRRPKLGGLRKARVDPRQEEEYMPRPIDNTRILFGQKVDNHLMNKFLNSPQALTRAVSPEFVLHHAETAEYLQIMPHKLPVYSFRNRQYVHVHVGNISTITKDEKARNSGFQDLVIPDGYRRLLTALVETHNSQGGITKVDLASLNDISSQIDIVRGKGRGLIILLHGPPGTGKTSTAETIAAFSGRPLYSITCGDLGTESWDVERNLEEHARRAQRWGCVLLLDEADVFLTRRDWRDMQRNALVSVFLRQLEYYSGILFLTTNRVGVLDEAFKSRIHISLQYPRILLDQTIQIWRKILDRLERDNERADVKVIFDKRALLSFAAFHFKEHEDTRSTWNGRQIRNAVSTAIALGKHDRDEELREAKERETENNEKDAEGGTVKGRKKKAKKTPPIRLTVANFKKIAEIARDFEDYLSKVRGQDSQVAKDHSLRYDEYTGADEYDEMPALRQRDRDYGAFFAARRNLSPNVPATPPQSRTSGKTKGSSVRRDRDGNDSTPVGRRQRREVVEEYVEEFIVEEHLEEADEEDEDGDEGDGEEEEEDEDREYL